jgi:hypothetical protein
LAPGIVEGRVLNGPFQLLKFNGQPISMQHTNIKVKLHNRNFAWSQSYLRSWVTTRVARWFVFQPKIPNWEKFSEPQIGKYWNILWPFGKFYGYLGHFVTIWYILCSFGMLQEKSGNPGYNAGQHGIAFSTINIFFSSQRAILITREVLL